MFLAIREWIQYFVSKWYIIFLFALVGAILGLGYSLTKKHFIQQLLVLF